MILMTVIMVLSFACAVAEMASRNWYLSVLLLILSCVCGAGMVVVDELRKQAKRNEELWGYLLEDLGKIRKTIKKKDAEDE